jgi:hypothetical protein
MAINIPLVQVDAQTPLNPSQLARILNQIQRNIIDGIKSLQTSINNSGTVVGQEITAYLTEAQFQQQMGSGWVLADGRNISGSAFAKLYGSNTLPDRRGTVSRMKDNGKGLDPAGDLALGAYEADTLGSHTHTATVSPNPHGHNIATVGVATAGANLNTPNYNGGFSNTTPTSTTSLTVTNASTGGAETRAKAIIANVFIRIN